MKIRSTAFCTGLVALVILAAPFAADARPFGHNGPGYHDGQGSHWSQMQQLPQEKRDQLQAMRLEQRKKMQPIRDQLWAKQTLLDALSRNPKAEPKDITALVDEIAALRSQLRDARIAFADKVKKEIGLDMPYGAFAMQDRGDGYGRHGGNHGNRGGGCWR